VTKRLVKIGRLSVGFKKSYSRVKDVFRYAGVIEIRPQNDDLPLYLFLLAPYRNRLDALQHLADVLESALMAVRLQIVKMRVKKEDEI